MADKKTKQATLRHPIPFAGTKLPATTTHIIISLDAGKLFYNDVRQFGWIKVVDEKEVVEKLSKFGPEPLSANFSLSYLKEIFSCSRRAIKAFLMDQHKIAGLGNIYSNDSLWEAEINPLRSANSLKEAEISKLRKAIIKILKEGIKYKGSSARDELYILPNGKLGKYQYHFRVYQRKGEKCQRCGAVIKRINLAGRGTFFCSHCQK